MTDCRHFLSLAYAGLLLLGEADAMAGQPAAQKIQNSKTPMQHTSKVVTLTAKQAMAAHNEDLRALMLALYELHPEELRKSAQVGAREMTDWVFDGKFGWRFDGLHGLQDQQALALLFDPLFQGDQVLALVVGLETTLFHGYGAENEFAIPPSPDLLSLQRLACHLSGFQQRYARQVDDVNAALLQRQPASQTLVLTTLRHILQRLPATEKLTCA